MSEQVTLQPASVGIIMDGNRRWASERGLDTLDGHTEGLETLITIAKHAKKKDIKHLVVFAFSTENWKREEKEVTYLMDLVRKALTKELDILAAENIRIRFVGDLARFPEDIQNSMQDIAKKTEGNTDATLWIALSYGGRAEILAAGQACVDTGEVCTEKTFEKFLWSGEMPDLDIVIRTSGEKRTSGFMTWKSVYSELFFIDTYWPAFSTSEFDAILEEYGARQRRYGV